MEQFGIKAQSRFDYVFNTNPATDTNPPIVNVTWLNASTGGIFVCIDNTVDNNVWAGYPPSIFYFDTTQNIPDITSTVLLFDSARDIDSAGLMVSGNITMNRDCFVRVASYCSLDNAADTVGMKLSIKNGTTTIFSAASKYETDYNSFVVSGVSYVENGDILSTELKLYGSDGTTSVGSMSYFSVEMV